MRGKSGAAVRIGAAVVLGVGVASSMARAEDTGKIVSAQTDPARFSYARTYCTPDNESHFADMTADLASQNFAPPASPIFIGGKDNASSVFVAGFEPRWGAADLTNHLYHPTPAVQFLTVAQGEFSITTSDGETRRLRPGGFLRLEDVAPCKGHITVVGDTTGFLIFTR